MVTFQLSSNLLLITLHTTHPPDHDADKALGGDNLHVTSYRLTKPKSVAGVADCLPRASNGRFYTTWALYNQFALRGWQMTGVHVEQDSGEQGWNE